MDLSSVLDNLLSDVWFELTFLLAVSLLSSFLFARLGQPRLIAYIVVGVVIGPVIRYISKTTGSPGELPETVMLLAQLGSIILLFMIGLECDLKEVYTRRSISIALGGVLLPWVAGYLVAISMGYGPDAVFIGATLVATSVAITAGVTSELGMMGTPVAYAIVGAAVVDDVLGMVVLAVSKGIASGGVDLAGVLLLLLGAILFIVLGAWVGSKVLTKLVFNVQVSGYRRKMPMSGFVLALTIAFLYSFVAEVIGLTAIVGAFVAGTAFSGSALRDGFRKGTIYLEALFVPLFFVSLGSLVDVDEVWNAIWFALVLTAVAIIAKIVGCGLPARLLGMKKWDSIAVGVGMTPRLEIALVIAFIGLSSVPSLIKDASTYSVVVFMGLATALFAPTLLKMTLRRGGHMLAVVEQ